MKTLPGPLSSETRNFSWRPTLFFFSGLSRATKPERRKLCRLLQSRGVIKSDLLSVIVHLREKCFSFLSVRRERTMLHSFFWPRRSWEGCNHYFHSRIEEYTVQGCSHRFYLLSRFVVNVSLGYNFLEHFFLSLTMY